MLRLSSPASVFAPAPAAVSVLASAVAGFRFSFVRRSPRSFSRWVVVSVFSSPAVAAGFASAVASGLSLPFCRVRRCFGGWGVSVPAFVRLLRLPRRSVFRVLPVRCPVAASLPASVRSVFARVGAVGFSGSRSAVPAVVPAVASAVRALRCPVFVGCAGALMLRFGLLSPVPRCWPRRRSALGVARLLLGLLRVCGPFRLLVLGLRVRSWAGCGCRFLLGPARLVCCRLPRLRGRSAVPVPVPGPRLRLLLGLVCLASSLGLRRLLVGALFPSVVVGGFLGGRLPSCLSVSSC